MLFILNTLIRKKNDTVEVSVKTVQPVVITNIPNPSYFVTNITIDTPQATTAANCGPSSASPATTSTTCPFWRCPAFPGAPTAKTSASATSRPASRPRTTPSDGSAGSTRTTGGANRARLRGTCRKWSIWRISVLRVGNVLR